MYWYTNLTLLHVFQRFPVTFGKQHMPRKTAPMHLLDSNGHRWPMTWLRDNETHMGLTRGWRDFCLAEGLSEGDVCLFELIELNKLTLLIHVFRSTEPRDANTQVIIHKKPSESRRKHHPSRDREKHNPASMEDKPCKMILYNKFHRARPLSREYSSVGRVRYRSSLSGLPKLMTWSLVKLKTRPTVRFCVKCPQEKTPLGETTTMKMVIDIMWPWRREGGLRGLSFLAACEKVTPVRWCINRVFLLKNENCKDSTLLPDEARWHRRRKTLPKRLHLHSSLKIQLLWSSWKTPTSTTSSTW